VAVEEEDAVEEVEGDMVEEDTGAITGEIAWIVKLPLLSSRIGRLLWTWT